MATIFTTPTTVYFLETPPPPLKVNLNGNYPYYPKYRLFFKETPPPPLKLNLNGNYRLCYAHGIQYGYQFPLNHMF